VTKATLVARVEDAEDEYEQPLVDYVRKLVEPTGKHSPVQCIRRFRHLVLVHSFLYYQCDSGIISDGEWDRYARLLKILQDSFPEACTQDFYDEEFVGWTGMTGFALTYDNFILTEAQRMYLLYTQTPLTLPPEMEAE